MPAIVTPLMSALVALSVAVGPPPATAPPAAPQKPASGPLPAPAAGEPNPAGPLPPKHTFESAVAHYMAGRILEAIDAYQHLFVTTGEPVCLANLGRLYEERGDVALATEYYRKFVLHPRALDAQRTYVRARLRAIAPGQEPPPNPPASAPEAETPAPAPAPPIPQPAPAGPAPAIDRSPRILLGVGGALALVGVPSLVVGGVLAGQSYALHTELAADTLDAGEDRGPIEDEATRKQGVAISLIACGAVAVTAGIVMMAIGARRARAQRSPRVAAGAGGLVFRF